MTKVTRKITQSGHQLCLLVLNEEEYERAVSQGQDLRDLAKANKGEDCKPLSHHQESCLRSRHQLHASGR